MLTKVGPVTVGLITRIKKEALFKGQYSINEEKISGSEVDNDELLMQLQVNF